MNKRKMYLQCGVMFVEESALPENARINANDYLTVSATGEPGHYIEGGAQIIYSVEEERWLKSDTAITCTLEGHEPLLMPPGVYRVTRQRECDWDGGNKQ